MIPLHFRLMISPDGEDEGGGVQEGDVDEMHPPRRAGHDASVSQNFRVGTRQVASYIQEMIHDNRREEMRVLLLRYGEDPSEGCGPPPASPLSPPPFLSCFPPLCLLFEPPPLHITSLLATSKQDVFICFPRCLMQMRRAGHRHVD